MPRLVACPSCRAHVMTDATECPHCGGSVRTCRALPWGAGAVLMGLTLSGCPADDGTESETMASTPGTTADTTGMPIDTTGTTEDVDASTFESAAAYGTPDTGVDTLPDDTGTTGSSGSTGDDATDTDTDTGTGGTTLEPEYGVPTTSG